MKALQIVALALLGAVAPVLAQPGGWYLLGFKTVGRGSDHDVITVDPRPQYRRLQLCAAEAPIDMQDFDVTYGNGNTENLAVRSIIRAGTCTRAIDLNGGARHITRIDLRYQKLYPRSRPPRIRVMGR
jgi:hypothetical protein